MYCPECRRIYPDGVFRCQDCDLDLVGMVPGGGSFELLPVLETHNVLELGLVRSLLASAGIPMEIEGADILHLGDAFLTAVVRVPADRAHEAAELLAAGLEFGEELDDDDAP